MMKLLTIFLLAAFAATSANSYSQGARFSLRLNDITVKEVFQQIEEKSEFILLYNEKSVDLNRKVNVRVKDETVESILEQVFEGTGNNWKIYDRQIVVLAAGETELRQEVIIAEEAGVQQPQRRDITGTVRDARNQPLPGVAVIVKGTTVGTVTDFSGTFQLSIPADAQIIEFSFVGMKRQEIPAVGRSVFEVVLEEETFGVDEVIVVGYGTQKRSDITGTVASLGKDRLEMVPNLNIAQAIQGAIPGVMIQTTSAGAAPSQTILVRGRNSIRASNDPLIVVDGVPYGGNISDLNPSEVESIEVLKDASAAAIYGSRGANGVILITTKTGNVGDAKFSYDGFYSLQSFSNLPKPLNGPEFYDFKQKRFPGQITLTEQEIYDSGKWVDWLELGLRNGFTKQHNLAASGGFNNTSYYIGAGMTDVQGLRLNDDYRRITTRFNIDTRIAGWITIGTRTQLSYEDQSGESPSMSGLFTIIPLSRAFDDDGNLTIVPWPEDNGSNPLQGTLYDDKSNSYQISTNNYAILDFPFIPGLNYRINTGVRLRFRDDATYRGRNTKSGLDAGGSSSTQRRFYNNYVLENIFSYSKEFGVHNVFATGVLSFEQDVFSGQSTEASQYPHDFLTYYSIAQAEIVSNSYSYNETSLISQMLRMNYSYDSRYLLTLTGRRDGYSGFGASSKWGVFPSVALGWNIINEEFFKWDELFSNLRFRLSWGLNGNQAVGAYESISRLSSDDYINKGLTLAGYRPSRLGQDNLGWESSRTINIGLDYGLLKNRITGDLNAYRTNTTDLLLNRSISAVHGITSITQNIGETQNTGLEFTINSRNIISNKNGFQWHTTGNLAYVQNEIVSLYGLLDDEGKEIDDIANAWFIGKPIRVNYDFKWLGTWQLDEIEEATKWGSQPGFVKLEDKVKDGILDAKDKQILGQQDPKLLWGLTNSFSYGNFKLDIFIHGVHGVTKNLFPYMTDLETYSVIRRNTFKKNWWTPEKPTNDFVMNHLNAEYMSGIRGYMYEDASFIRIKDLSLSYDLSDLSSRIGIEKLKLYVTGRNLYTFTKWRGLDPELGGQIDTPLQKEFVFGVNIGF